ncbi:chromodomain Y-like protein isoform X2 [Mercenaria mercenaria]|uniref:chromodomain Y-like protein isoform X2 n=1 Tax=Mercenaria mercenaria TaxID=6596 RepID=UPI00234F3BA1|nr:chromodomain Y-like protein isoform X2 [Mercenaria mercenaria]
MSASEGELEVGEILGERKSSRRGLEYLVRWKDFGASNDTWEPLKNLSNAARAIADFHAKTMSQKKTKRRSKSRSRSRSSSRRRRSNSRSPGRKSTTKTTTKTSSSPTKEETKTETITRSPGRFEKTTETLTRSILTPSSTQRSTYLTRTSEVKTTTTNRDLEPVKPAKSADCGWLQVCCVPMQKMKECCAGLVRSDYPAIVVCATIAIIFLSFVLEKNVDFEKVWAAIVAFFTGIWAWLTQLVSK